MNPSQNLVRGVLDEAALTRAATGPHPHKADLVRALHRYREVHDLTMTQLGHRCGIAQTRLSKLYKGDFAEVSSDKLLTSLARLGVHVAITIDLDPAPPRAGAIEIRTLPEALPGETSAER